MTHAAYLWTPPPVRSLPVRGRAERAPVNRLFFVGRNYHAHALEMGRPVDKSVEQPFYFTKSPDTLVPSGATVAYPPGTANYHYEMELVLVVGKPAFRVPQAEAASVIYGYACGLDMTRRDLQATAKARGNPWDLAKNVESGAVCGEIQPAAGQVLRNGEIVLRVNGEVRQRADLSDMIWSIPEIIADLSSYYHLQPGDLIYTGTPEGVGPVRPGDRLEGSVQGAGKIEFEIGQAE